MEELLIENFDNDILRLVGVGFSNIILAKEYKQDYNLFTYQKILKMKTWYNVIEEILKEWIKWDTKNT